MRVLCDPVNRCFLNSSLKTLSPEQALRLEGYQRRYLPQSVLQTMEDKTLSDDTRAYAVFLWMYQLAQRILTGYRKCWAPFGGRPAVNTGKTCLNLLSDEGEEVLFLLNEFQGGLERYHTIADAEHDWKLLMPHVPLTTILWDTTVPKYLNTHFFKDYTPFFKKIVHLNYKFIPEKDYVTFPINSGCENGCPHCGAEATAPFGIVSLPFPIVKEIEGVAYQKEWRCYNASDPLDYYDPLFQGSFLSAPYILTRGYRPHILNNPEHPLFEKEQRRYDALRAYRDRAKRIVLSCIDFGAECFENPRSWQRLYANLDMLKGGNYGVQFLGQGEQSNQFFKRFVQVPLVGHEFFGQIAPIGRAASDTYRSFVSANENLYNGGESEIILEADGSLYFSSNVQKDSQCRIVRRLIGNLFKDEKHLWQQLEYLEDQSDVSVFEQDERFPLVLPAYQQKGLKNQVITLETLPPLPKGTVVARQWPDLPVIKDTTARPLRPPVTWQGYCRQSTMIQDGSTCFYDEANGIYLGPKDFLQMPGVGLSTKKISQYSVMGDIQDTIKIFNQSGKNIALVNAMPTTDHQNRYYVRVPCIQIKQADYVGLNGFAPKVCRFPDSKKIEITESNLDNIKMIQGADNGALFMSYSVLRENTLLTLQGLKHIWLIDNTYKDKELKVPADCKTLFIKGQGPACLDLRSCSDLQNIGFNEHQQGVVLLPPRVSQKVLKRILKRYTGAQVKYPYCPPKKDRSR